MREEHQREIDDNRLTIEQLRDENSQMEEQLNQAAAKQREEKIQRGDANRSVELLQQSLSEARIQHEGSVRQHTAARQKDSCLIEDQSKRIEALQKDICQLKAAGVASELESSKKQAIQQDLFEKTRGATSEVHLKENSQLQR